MENNMKNKFYIGAIFLAIIFATSCGQTEEKTKTTTDTSQPTETAPAVDTSGSFIKRLLNCSPKDVAKNWVSQTQK